MHIEMEMLSAIKMHQRFVFELNLGTNQNTCSFQGLVAYCHGLFHSLNRSHDSCEADTVKKKLTRNCSDRCDIYKVMKVVHGNRSDNHCNQSDKRPSVPVNMPDTIRIRSGLAGKHWPEADRMILAHWSASGPDPFGQNLTRSARPKSDPV